ncbi:hypothetical protein Taro_050023, partial [Colocasia esculenta]|nr:hypothetical protein [Colocasia esculenta]
TGSYPCEHAPLCSLARGALHQSIRSRGRSTEMIGWGDIYKVVEAVLPLYTTLALGYASVRWWRVFTPEQSDAVNKFVSYFALPLFNLEFMLHTDPFAMNFRFVAADAIAKAATVLALAAYGASRGGEDGLACAVSGFSLVAFTNCLVVGVPLLRAMYGPLGQDLAIQSFVLQALVWLTVFILALEYRKAVADSGAVAGDGAGAVCIELPTEKAADGDQVVGAPARTALASVRSGKKPPSFWSLVKVVLLKLSQNPNTYSSVLGIAWAAVANRWHINMPAIVEGSVLIMSRAGAGLAMFSMGEYNLIFLRV